MYQPKDNQVYGRQLKVQRLSIPFKVTHHATAASKVIATDEPSLVFFNFASLTGISTGTGALETGETPPSFATATDSTGVFNVCIKTGEALVKAVNVSIHGRNSEAITNLSTILAFSTGSTNSGQSIFANVTSGINFSTTDLDAVLEVEYITQE